MEVDQVVRPANRYNGYLQVKTASNGSESHDSASMPAVGKADRAGESGAHIRSPNGALSKSEGRLKSSFSGIRSPAVEYAADIRRRPTSQLSSPDNDVAARSKQLHWGFVPDDEDPHHLQYDVVHEKSSEYSGGKRSATDAAESRLHGDDAYEQVAQGSRALTSDFNSLLHEMRQERERYDRMLHVHRAEMEDIVSPSQERQQQQQHTAYTAVPKSSRTPPPPHRSYVEDDIEMQDAIASLATTPRAPEVMDRSMADVDIEIDVEEEEVEPRDGSNHDVTEVGTLAARLRSEMQQKIISAVDDLGSQGFVPGSLRHTRSSETQPSLPPHPLSETSLSSASSEHRHTMQAPLQMRALESTFASTVGPLMDTERKSDDNAALVDVVTFRQRHDDHIRMLRFRCFIGANISTVASTAQRDYVARGPFELTVRHGDDVVYLEGSTTTENMLLVQVPASGSFGLLPTAVVVAQEENGNDGDGKGDALTTARRQSTSFQQHNASSYRHNTSSSGVEESVPNGPGGRQRLSMLASVSDHTPMITGIGPSKWEPSKEEVSMPSASAANGAMRSGLPSTTAPSLFHRRPIRPTKSLLAGNQSAASSGDDSHPMHSAVARTPTNAPPSLRPAPAPPKSVTKSTGTSPISSEEVAWAIHHRGSAHPSPSRRSSSGFASAEHQLSVDSLTHGRHVLSSPPATPNDRSVSPSPTRSVSHSLSHSPEKRSGDTQPSQPSQPPPPPQEPDADDIKSTRRLHKAYELLGMKPPGGAAHRRADTDGEGGGGSSPRKRSSTQKWKQALTALVRGGSRHDSATQPGAGGDDETPRGRPLSNDFSSSEPIIPADTETFRNPLHPMNVASSPTKEGASPSPSRRRTFKDKLLTKLTGRRDSRDSLGDMGGSVSGALSPVASAESLPSAEETSTAPPAAPASPTVVALDNNAHVPEAAATVSPRTSDVVSPRRKSMLQTVRTLFTGKSSPSAKDAVDSHTAAPEGPLPAGAAGDVRMSGAAEESIALPVRLAPTDRMHRLLSAQSVPTNEMQGVRRRVVEARAAFRTTYAGELSLAPGQRAVIVDDGSNGKSLLDREWAIVRTIDHPSRVGMVPMSYLRTVASDPAPAEPDTGHPERRIASSSSSLVQPLSGGGGNGVTSPLMRRRAATVSEINKPDVPPLVRHSFASPSASLSSHVSPHSRGSEYGHPEAPLGRHSIASSVPAPVPAQPASLSSHVSPHSRSTSDAGRPMSMPAHGGVSDVALAANTSFDFSTHASAAPQMSYDLAEQRTGDVDANANANANVNVLSDESRHYLTSGTIFKKVGAGADVQKRHLWLSDDLSELYWKDPGKSERTKQTIRLAKLQRVERNPSNPNVLSFYSKTRRLDMEALSHDDCTKWVDALNDLIASHRAEHPAP